MGVLQGAGTGAAIGSVIPGIGTSIVTGKHVKETPNRT